MNTNKPVSIDEYIAAFPQDIQDILKQIRNTIHEAAPDAKEAIKYDMPSFVLNGNLIHFAAYKKHIGLYPVPRAADEFKAELETYGGEKSTAQFQLNKPIPLDLITRIVKYNVERNLAKA